MKNLIIILLSILVALLSYAYAKRIGHDLIEESDEVAGNIEAKTETNETKIETDIKVIEDQELFIENIKSLHDADYNTTYTTTVLNNTNKTVKAFEVYNDGILRGNQNTRAFYGDPLRFKVTIHPKERYTFSVNSVETKLFSSNMGVHVCSVIFSDGSKQSYH